MIPRLIVPKQAQIPPAEAGHDTSVRQDLLVPRRLISADTQMTPLPEGASMDVSTSARELMLPKMLVPQGSKVVQATDSSAAHAIAARQPVFKEALLERVSLSRQNKLAEWMLSIVVHSVVISILLILPLFYTHVLDMKKFEVTYLTARLPPGAPPPPLPPAKAIPQPAIRKPNPVQTAKLTMPVAIPKAIHMPSAPEAPPEVIAAIPGGVVGGIPGGEISGLAGGLEPAEPGAPPPPVAPAVAAAPGGPLHVGGNVKPPRAISKPEPNYPRLARQSRIQGDVEIDAVIDSQGNVVKAHAMSGPPLLMSAALEAVKGWKYEPTYLNGVPCSIELTVYVTFKLS